MAYSLGFILALLRLQRRLNETADMRCAGKARLLRGSVCVDIGGTLLARGERVADGAYPVALWLF